MSAEDLIHFKGESQLLGFGESDTTGAWVKFRVLPEDLDKFRGCKGERFFLTTVELQNDDTPVDQKKKSKLGTFSNNVAGMCRDPDFQEWFGVDSEAGAREKILEMFGIKSRADFDDSTDLQDRFNREVRRPYLGHPPYGGPTA